MKVAIISDSHGRIDRLKEVLSLCEKKNITNLIHAGDFAVDGVLAILESFPHLKIKIARGNSDVDDQIVNAVQKLKNVKIDDVLNFSIDGIRFQMTHKPEDLNIYENPKVDIFIHGHTHKPRFERHESQIVINPGALIEDPKFLIFDTETKKFEVEVLKK